MPKQAAKSNGKNLASALRSKGAKVRRDPVWKGPEVDGITQSLLSRFLVCPERFRLLVVEGLKPADRFNARLEYGNLWHACEEAVAGNKPWEPALKNAVRSLADQYRFDGPEVEKWYNVCKTQFPYYLGYWNGQPDSLANIRTPLLQEYAFNIPYPLPSGRIVWLRGKFDSVDIVKVNGKSSVWLMENKTKGDIDEQQLQRQLTFDLQTMLYLVALSELQRLCAKAPHGIKSPYDWHKMPVVGVRYNVIRRPLSGGKGSIRKHQPTKSNPQGETDAEFYSRLGTYFRDEPSYWFMRWNVEVSKVDIQRFKQQFLDPTLERLCGWWESIEDGGTPFKNELHYRFPYGVFNPMLEGNVSDLDNYLATGDETGLQRTTNLFPEL